MPVVMGIAGSSAMTISPIEVDSLTRFQESIEAAAPLAGAAGMDTSAVIAAGTFPAGVTVLTGDADCWVHPAARRNAAMSTHASSTARTGDDIV